MNDWYKKGELPPVGTKCEYKPLTNWVKCTVLFIGNSKAVLGVQEFEICVDIAKVKFRPLRTETDKLVEQMYDDADGEYDFDTAIKPTNQRLLTACRLLHKQGYRKVKPMTEDEFVKLFANQIGAREIYQSGCRFIEQGE